MMNHQRLSKKRRGRNPRWAIVIWGFESRGLDIGGSHEIAQSQKEKDGKKEQIRPIKNKRDIIAESLKMEMGRGP